jgi:uncharacterized surface protein with fasciclin (FAS1) repeats
MKIMNHIKSASVALLVSTVLLLAGCASDFTSPASPSGTTLVGVANTNDSLKAFVAALTKTGLASNFDNVNGGQYTVFAPTNYAFVKYLRSAGVTIAGVNASTAGDAAATAINALTTTSTPTISALATRLNYHIISSVLPSSQITYGQGFITWNGARLSVSKVTGGAYNFILNAGIVSNGANIIDADKTASNGVAHVIDAVMAPISSNNIWASSLLNFGVSYGATVTVSIGGTTMPYTSGAYDISNAPTNTTDGDYNLFAMALVRSGLATTIIPNASTLPDFTVFAPTDAAFKTYLNVADEPSGRSAINALAPDALASIVKYHIVTGRLVSYDLIAASTIPTSLSGKSFSVNGALGISDDKGNTAAVISKKDQLTNAGILHAVSAVLEHK